MKILFLLDKEVELVEEIINQYSQELQDDQYYSVKFGPQTLDDINPEDSEKIVMLDNIIYRLNRAIHANKITPTKQTILSCQINYPQGTKLPSTQVSQP